MERFTVNGKEVEYDPFDLDVMDSYLSGLSKEDDERRVKLENESPVDSIRRACNAILDFFDDQLGEGKAEELFGQRINAKAIFDGYQAFTTQVNSCISDYAKSMNTVQTAPVNRAQRREEKRRRS